MANTTIGFGVALIVLGAAGYFGSESHSPTALIPAAFGVVLWLLGAWAKNPAKRAMAMHVASIVGALGFAGSLPGLMKIGRVLGGEAVPRAGAVVAQSIMAVLMLVFVALCVKSFVDARRRRAV